MLTDPPQSHAYALKKRAENYRLGLGFSSATSFFLWISFAFVAVLSLFPRFHDWANPLMDPHPIRQSQTALVIRELANGRATLLDYRSPFDGALWSFVIEFPIYQALVAIPVRWGVSVEVASRFITFLSFCIGLVFFFSLVKRFFGKETAAWSTLLYFISPFSLAYSRVCLIDPFGVSMILGAAWFGVRSLENSSGFLALVAFLLGALAGMIKPTIWYSYATLFFIMASYHGFKKVISWKKWVMTLLLLLGQFFCAVYWLRYSMIVRGVDGPVVGQDTSIWILGSPESRLMWSCWKTIGMVITRWIWHDWMVPLAVVAFFSRWKKMTILLAAMALFSILGPFSVHRFHDYYFLTEAPYLFVLVGIGMTELLRQESIVKTGVLAGAIFVFAYRLVTIGPTIAPYYRNWRDAVIPYQQLANQTDSADIIYAETSPESWFIPLYSDRYVLLSYRFDPKSSLINPTVYWFHKSAWSFELLRQHKTIWVNQPMMSPLLYRVAEKGAFHLAPNESLISTGDIEMLEGETAITAQRFCSLGSWHDLGESEKPWKLHLDQTQIPLPQKRYLYIPKLNIQRCEFTRSS